MKKEFIEKKRHRGYMIIPSLKREKRYYSKYERKQEDNTFFGLEFGSEFHGKNSFRIWISPKLIIEKIDDEEFLGEIFQWDVSFPLENAKIEKTEKGSWVIRPQQGWIIYDIQRICSKRKESFFYSCSLSEEEKSEGEKIEYKMFHSPTGRLGYATGMLISVPKENKIKLGWQVNDLDYNKLFTGDIIIYPDGKKETKITWSRWEYSKELLNSPEKIL